MAKSVAPINSIKHYVHRTQGGISSGGISVNDVAKAVVAPAAATSFDVLQGSVLRAVHLEIWLIGSDTAGTIGQFDLTVEKLPSGLTAMTFTQSVNLGSYPNKKNVLYATQGNFGQAVDGISQMPLIKGWFKIPKGKQRMGLGDRIVVNVSATGESMNICGLFVYKEYR